MEISTNTTFMKAMYVIEQISILFQHSLSRIRLDHEIVCIGVILQGIYAVVEFGSREGVASLLEEAAIPSVNHEAMVPFKSRLLSLRNLGSADSPNQQSGPQCQPQTTVPINQLIQTLSKEGSVSVWVLTLTHTV